MLERFVKKRNGNCLKERLKPGTRSYYQERILSRERILNQKCVPNHLEIIKRFFFEEIYNIILIRLNIVTFCSKIVH